MDAFFVSVEELFDPSLIASPSSSVDRPTSEASLAALGGKFGVHSAMPLRTAARLCPHAIFVDGHPTRYRETGKVLMRILNSFSPQVDMDPSMKLMESTGTERLHGSSATWAGAPPA